MRIISFPSEFLWISPSESLWIDFKFLQIEKENEEGKETKVEFLLQNF